MILFSEYYESLSLMMTVLQFAQFNVNITLVSKIVLNFCRPSSTGRYVNLQNTEKSFDHVYCSDKIYRMRAIITRGLYIFHPIFQCN